MAGRVETRRDMANAGYTFKGRTNCKGCGQPIEWWLTTNRKPIPYDPMPENEFAPVTCHWGTCPTANELRGTGQAAKTQQTGATRARLIGTLQQTTGARAILALYDEGPVLAWREGLDPEDLRNEAISAANKLRWHVQLQLEQGARP